MTKSGWGTSSEIAFIRGLGSHVNNACGDRLALLRSYEAGMSKRVGWGAINAEEIRAFVAAAIAAEVRQHIAQELVENRRNLEERTFNQGAIHA